MEENIAALALAYELIPDHHEEVAETDALVDEGTEIMEQRRSNSELVEAYQPLIRIGQAWNTGKRLKDEVKDLTILTTCPGTTLDWHTNIW